MLLVAPAPGPPRRPARGRRFLIKVIEGGLVSHLGPLSALKGSIDLVVLGLERVSPRSILTPRNPDGLGNVDWQANASRRCALIKIKTNEVVEVNDLILSVPLVPPRGTVAEAIPHRFRTELVSAPIPHRFRTDSAPIPHRFRTEPDEASRVKFHGRNFTSEASRPKLHVRSFMGKWGVRLGAIKAGCI